MDWTTVSTENLRTALEVANRTLADATGTDLERAALEQQTAVAAALATR